MPRRVFAAVAAVCLVGLAAAWAATPSPDQVQRMVVARAAADHVPLLRPGQVPPTLANALIAIEDERFERHHGVDLLGLARALAHDVWYRCLCEGGSTLTQQVVKLVYLGRSDAGWNKPLGMFMAFKLETGVDKPTILADYLSLAPTGAGLEGAQAAACAYFGLPLDRLDLGQAALIAGMPQAPSAYDPRYHPQAAQSRRDAVLHQMVSDGYATPAQAAAAAASPVVSDPRPLDC